MKMKFLIVCSVILFVVMLETKAKMIGGLQDVDTNDANLVPIIEFTETMLNRGVNSIYSHKIGKILKAQKQLVAGDKFYLTFEFNRTNSPKGQPISKNYEITFQYISR
ncbi:unnamed protein product [Oppiella nova]|uniref:Cystatin domain-containing protein n=1 Tax=Oppiella nova TaxID=334625 RepID=A0A7R9LYR5_9ACAR|nr:unnamed protein product [Oppiella nova]CAG2167603.1 unnamed protein product [Oppiella nova]